MRCLCSSGASLTWRNLFTGMAQFQIKQSLVNRSVLLIWTKYWSAKAKAPQSRTRVGPSDSSFACRARPARAYVTEGLFNSSRKPSVPSRRHPASKHCQVAAWLPPFFFLPHERETLARFFPSQPEFIRFIFFFLPHHAVEVELPSFISWPQTKRKRHQDPAITPNKMCPLKIMNKNWMQDPK